MQKPRSDRDRVKSYAVIMALLLVAAVDARAQRAVPMTLRGMVQQAGTIVHAVVTETRTGRDPVTGMPATWVTLEVGENFHGAPGTTFTFKQIGGEANGMAYRPADVPRYTQNEELVLFLYPAHPRTGFRSPVGLGQGKFVVKSSISPRKKVVEQVTHSARLLKEGGARSLGGDISFDAFASEIRAIVRAEKGSVK